MGNKKKGNRDHVILESREGGVTYTYKTTKNRKNTPESLSLKKYNPRLKKRSIFKEIK